MRMNIYVSVMFLGKDFTHTRNYSENVAAEIDSEIRLIVEEAYDTCTELLNTHMEQLHSVAQYLYDHEKMTGEQFARMMSGEPMPEETIRQQPEETETGDSAGAVETDAASPADGDASADRASDSDKDNA